MAAIASLSAGGSAFGQTGASITDPPAKGAAFEELIHLADARNYRHCHNIHTRVYCHRRDRLPMNWPPLSDTPSQDRQKPRSVPERPPHALDQA
ncbi:hypothetical protein HYPDE_23368 [Hyphomicrobium denitrificans 1NES1]|uniref:Uncharacterized protein n=1 Tax=Hyphomicrobium denitrificans 1NES1 TaxID=670307 RepID=N0B8G9_9HYPH|nr:hypothetical protein HYPDE_23368 [Hyphomicrobium denitrificans 1NES1]